MATATAIVPVVVPYETPWVFIIRPLNGTTIWAAVGEVAKQSYQVAYWKQRFGISEKELMEAVRAVGGLARNVEAYLRQKRLER
jgi:hypothetical protein